MNENAWTELAAANGRRPLCSIIAATTLFLCLFTPYLLVTLPVMVTVALSIAASFRRERPKWLPYVVGGLAIALVVSAGPSRSAFERSEPTLSTSNAVLYKKASWEYGSDKDEMRGDVTNWAAIKSPTDLNLSPPYDAANVAELWLWSSGGDAALSVTQGQFTCRNGDMLPVKFDNGPVYEYACREPESGNSDTLYVNAAFEPVGGQPASLLDGLSKAKKMTIEVPFYQDGTKQITFNVSGLDLSRL
ncbi:MAG: hypothetical protein ABIT16_02430 [Croceibacterium sp.]